MKKYLKTILREGHIQTLHGDKKSAIKARVIDFVEKNPVSKEHVRLNKREQAYVFSFMNFLPQKHMTIVLVIALLVGGGTSYAAEGTLPGDFLYPIKVSVNEGVRSTLAVSAESRAEWDTARAKRRLEEAVTLAAKGELSTEKREMLEQKFEGHARNAEEFYARAEERGDVDIAVVGRTKLEATREAHVHLLRNMPETENREEVRVLLASLEARSGLDMAVMADSGSEISMMAMQVQAPENGRRVTEAQVVSEASVHARMKLAERTRMRTEAEFEKNKDTLSTRVRQDIEAKIMHATNVFVEGELALEAGMYVEALALFQQSFALATEAHVYVTTAGKIQKYISRERSVSTNEQTEEKAENQNQNIRTEVRGDVRTSTMLEGRGEVQIEIEHTDYGDRNDDQNRDTREGRIEAETRIRVDVAL